MSNLDYKLLKLKKLLVIINQIILLNILMIILITEILLKNKEICLKLIFSS